MYYYIFVTLYPKLQNLSFIGQGYKKKRSDCHQVYVQLTSVFCSTVLDFIQFWCVFGGVFDITLDLAPI